MCTQGLLIFNGPDDIARTDALMDWGEPLWYLLMKLDYPRIPSAQNPVHSAFINLPGQDDEVDPGVPRFSVDDNVRRY